MQRVASEVEQPSRLVSVEDVHQIEAKVPLKPFHIRISTVKDLQNAVRRT